MEFMAVAARSANIGLKKPRSSQRAAPERPHRRDGVLPGSTLGRRAAARCAAALICHRSQAVSEERLQFPDCLAALCTCKMLGRSARMVPGIGQMRRFASEAFGPRATIHGESLRLPGKSDLSGIGRKRCEAIWIGRHRRDIAWESRPPR